MPQGYDITKEDEARIISTYQGGMTQKETANHLGFCVHTVGTVLRRNHITIRGWGYSPTTKQKMLSAYLSGASVVAIAAEFGLDSCAIATMLRRDFGVEIRKGGSYNRKYFFDESFFDEINTEEKAYWLGFIVADGCNRTSNLVITSHKQDEIHIQKFKEAIGSEQPFKYQSNWCYFQATSRRMCDSLSSLGVVPRKTHCSIYPPISPEFDRPFIRGLWDGDGGMSIVRSVRTSKPQINWTQCGSLELLKAVRARLLEYTGLEYLALRPHSTIYRIVTAGAGKVSKLMNWLYTDATVLLERKRDRYNNYLKIRDEWYGGSVFDFSETQEVAI